MAAGEGAKRSQGILVLRELIDAAVGLAADLAADPLLDRLICVFGRMPAEDRETLLGVLEREVELRVLERTMSQEALSGLVPSRPNPNARLYTRVVRGQEAVPYLSRDEMMLAIIRAGRAMHQTLATTTDDVGWRAVVAEALEHLGPEARAAVRWTNATMLALLDEIERPRSPAEPSP